MNAWWASYCLRRAEAARDACWGVQGRPSTDRGCHYNNTPGVDRRAERDRWYARYDRAILRGVKDFA